MKYTLILITYSFVIINKFDKSEKLIISIFVAMKNSIYMLLFIAAVFSACNKGSNETTETSEAVDETGIEQGDQTLNVNTSESQLEWKASKVTGTHNGTVPISGGTINLKDGEIVSGSFTIDMTAIEVIDITDEKTKGDFLDHMASDDFFSTEENPTATLTITSIENGQMTANLTIKGITKSITFPYEASINDEVLTANASFTIDRTEWEIRYGSGKFFEDLGDKMINDAIELSVSITAGL
jgi:polyisoprenoid-binding protein YceI